MLAIFRKRSFLDSTGIPPASRSHAAMVLLDHDVAGAKFEAAAEVGDGAVVITASLACEAQAAVSFVDAGESLRHGLRERLGFFQFGGRELFL